MWRKFLKIFFYGLILLSLFFASTYLYLRSQKGTTAAEKLIFKEKEKPVLVFAHRGGGGIFPENTLPAFEHSARLGADVLELDIHATSDGKIVVFHDASVDRTTNGSGRIGAIPLAELKKLDTADKFSTDGGQTFPFRGKNITIPTLEEIFDAFPDKKFNIEPKQSEPSLIKPLCSILRARKMTERVIVGSFQQAVLDEFRLECPEAATSASPSEVSAFLAYQKAGLGDSCTPPMQALQVPERLGNVHIVTKDFVETAHKLNLQVHVWTINETDDMKRLLALGVDGIMTDYPERLIELLNKTVIITKPSK